MAKTFSPEYSRYINSDLWRKGWRRKLALQLVFGRDAICPLLAAHHAEHVTYRNLTHELPLRDLVPLNRGVHLHIITPIKDLLRRVLGRRLGNGLMAWFLRFCVVFWWLMALSGIRWLMALAGNR